MKEPAAKEASWIQHYQYKVLGRTYVQCAFIDLGLVSFSVWRVELGKPFTARVTVRPLLTVDIRMWGR